MRLLTFVSVLAFLFTGLAASPAQASEAESTSYLRVVPMTIEDCSPPREKFWTLFDAPCIPGAMTIGVTSDAFETFQFADLYRVDKVKNSPKFCKGLKKAKKRKCLKGSHFTRTLIKTNNVCDREIFLNPSGKIESNCLVKRYFPRSGELPPGNYIFNLYKRSPGQWKCSINYRDLCRWSNGYTVTGDIRFTWNGEEIQSERVIGETFL